MTDINMKHSPINKEAEQNTDLYKMISLLNGGKGLSTEARVLFMKMTGVGLASMTRDVTSHELLIRMFMPGSPQINRSEKAPGCAPYVCGIKEMK